MTDFIFDKGLVIDLSLFLNASRRAKKTEMFQKRFFNGLWTDKVG